MLGSNYHIYHCKLKEKKRFKKIKIIPYLPTLKLKNKSETDLFFSRPYLDAHADGYREGEEDDEEGEDLEQGTAAS